MTPVVCPNPSGSQQLAINCRFSPYKRVSLPRDTHEEDQAEDIRFSVSLTEGCGAGLDSSSSNVPSDVNNISEFQEELS